MLLHYTKSGPYTFVTSKHRGFMTTTRIRLGGSLLQTYHAKRANARAQHEKRVEMWLSTVPQAPVLEPVQLGFDFSEAS